MFNPFKWLIPEKSAFDKLYDLIIADNTAGIPIGDMRERINSLYEVMLTVGDGKKATYINELLRSEVYAIRLKNTKEN